MAAYRKLGILGGGQLGKMLIQKAAQMGMHVSYLETSKDCPAYMVSPNIHIGNFKDFDDVYNFGKDLDVLTVEIEHVNLDALYKLEVEGVEIHPSPRVLDCIRNKGRQKQFYNEFKIKSSEFKIFENKAQLLDHLKTEELPVVVKSTEGGYDGKGVWFIKKQDQLNDVPDTELLLEEAVEIEKELAVIACSNGSETVCYETVEMVFDPEANLVDYLLHPAQISEDINQKAQNTAREVINAFSMQGLLAVELFLTKSGDILVNEVAPRPHNSGHHTIESHTISQYEAHLRGILSLPLPLQKSETNGAMLNLLGEESEGNTTLVGLEKLLNLSNCSLHLYGKSTSKPKRKMGHITILDKDLEELKNKIDFAKKNFKIIGQ